MKVTYNLFLYYFFLLMDDMSHVSLEKISVEINTLTYKSDSNFLQCNFKRKDNGNCFRGP